MNHLFGHSKIWKIKSFWFVLIFFFLTRSLSFTQNSKMAPDWTDVTAFAWALVSVPASWYSKYWTARSHILPRAKSGSVTIMTISSSRKWVHLFWDDKEVCIVRQRFIDLGMNMVVWHRPRGLGRLASAPPLIRPSHWCLVDVCMCVWVRVSGKWTSAKPSERCQNDVRNKDLNPNVTSLT